MTHAPRIRRPFLAFAALFAAAALADPALAGNRAVPGSEEPTTRNRGGSSVEGASPAATAPVRREHASIEPGEGYVPLSRTASPSAAPAPMPAEPATAPVPAPRTEQPAAQPKAANRAQGPQDPARRVRPGKSAPAPAKMSLPNLPATPGMGTLLRVGVTAGREHS